MGLAAQGITQASGGGRYLIERALGRHEQHPEGVEYLRSARSRLHRAVASDDILHQTAGHIHFSRNLQRNGREYHDYRSALSLTVTLGPVGGSEGSSLSRVCRVGHLDLSSDLTRRRPPEQVIDHYLRRRLEVGKPLVDVVALEARH